MDANQELILKTKIDVPIFEAVVWIVVTENIAIQRRAMEHWFGPVPEDDIYDALCSYGRGHNFALFFEPDACTVKTVSHEVFHLTHRILDWAGANFDSYHHEPAALLHGWLMREVAKKLEVLPE